MENKIVILNVSFLLALTGKIIRESLTKLK